MNDPAPRKRSPLDVDIQPQGYGLRAHVSGVENYENTFAYWRSIVAVLGQTPSERLLVVDELQGTPLSEREWMELVLSMGGLGLERLRIAHVKTRGRNEVEFCELYARSAGIDARVFTDEAQAVAWLEHGDAGSP